MHVVSALLKTVSCPNLQSQSAAVLASLLLDPGHVPQWSVLYCDNLERLCLEQNYGPLSVL